MPSTNLPLTSRFSIIEVLLKLFTIGIHSSEEGPKAWFETFAVTATLMACGYLAWYYGIFIILSLIFGAIAAGMFVFLAPAYTIQNNIATKPAVNTLKTISRIKTERVNSLTGNELIEEKARQIKAINELAQNFPHLIQEYPELGKIFETIRQGAAEASVKSDIEEQERTRQKQQEQRQREERERTLNELRARAGEPSGYPPDPNNPKHPPPGYPIKVTKNLTNESHKGIYYRQDDYDYWDYNADWWFESEAHVPKHKYRRPRLKGKGRGFRP
ncbi:MAG: hypothetical protein KME25_18040 [Symplocastrum torsivum CPER-KK1]|jgi:hypothetical protein|uniref:Uncharacterized protein n=1 Tax=Symplocastrum torsivum CPER-KK1 TaxID=450513 RepID=A0A951PPF0_9CYAN|nr:hypothetical protein [Symplocastrum torsivum CPER-KK1]